MAVLLCRRLRGELIAVLLSPLGGHSAGVFPGGPGILDVPRGGKSDLSHANFSGGNSDPLRLYSLFIWGSITSVIIRWNHLEWKELWSNIAVKDGTDLRWNYPRTRKRCRPCRPICVTQILFHAINICTCVSVLVLIAILTRGVTRRSAVWRLHMKLLCRPKR